jgi:FKBP-type peptidyl-prolyl cis-trans isomerase 2
VFKRVITYRDKEVVGVFIGFSCAIGLNLLTEEMNLLIVEVKEATIVIDGNHPLLVRANF